MRICIIILFPLFCFSQQKDISGIVFDHKDTPFPGVDITNVSSKIKVYTDFDGKYTIKARVGDTLTFSMTDCYKSDYKIVNESDSINAKVSMYSEIKEDYCETRPKDFYVFVAEKKDFNTVFVNDECVISMDQSAISTYKIIKNIYGDYNKQFITFKAYDHNSIIPFGFSKTKYALLFIVSYCDEYFSIKYQYYNVYKTKDNRFAVRYPIHNFKKIDSVALKPELIDYDNLFIDIGNIAVNSDSLSLSFPKEYYKIEGKKAIPLKGNYVEDVFEYWKRKKGSKRYFKK